MQEAQPDSTAQTQQTSQEDDEISLIDLALTLWGERKLIAMLTGACSIIAIIVSLLLPVVWKADAVVQVKGSSTSSKGGGIASLAGIASVAGVSLGGDQTLEATMGILKSKEMIRTFIRRNELTDTIMGDDENAFSIKKLLGMGSTHNNPEMRLEKAREIFEKKIITIATDTKAGLTTVSMRWKDPETATDWANLFVQQANNYLRNMAIERARKNLEHLETELPKTMVVAVQQAEFRLIEEQVKSIMVASVESEFAIRVIDPAVKPLLRDSPKRGLIVILATLGGAILSVLFVFTRKSVREKDLFARFKRPT